MPIPQEIYRIQSSLSLIFDRIPITHEIKADLSLEEFSQQEIDQLSLLIEKFENLLEEIRNNPSDIKEALDQRLLIRLGNYYYILDDEVLALEYYDLSNLVEENEWAYYNSGIILRDQGNFQSAYKKFDQAIKLKPDFSQALRHQAEILLQEKKDQMALEKLQRSQQLNPNDPETNKLLADYYLEHGEKKEALSRLKAIHHQDEEVRERIDKLERKRSFLGKITDKIRKN